MKSARPPRKRAFLFPDPPPFGFSTALLTDNYLDGFLQYLYAQKRLARNSVLAYESDVLLFIEFLCRYELAQVFLSLGGINMAGSFVRVLGKGSKERLVPFGELAREDTARFKAVHKKCHPRG